MKKLILTAVMVLAFVSTAIAADCWVDGYYKKNGTYVQGYWRTCPNNNIYDNFSTKGNINPYTGQIGTVNPYQQPQPLWELNNKGKTIYNPNDPDFFGR